jgi:hypothetical protein
MTRLATMQWSALLSACLVMFVIALICTVLLAVSFLLQLIWGLRFTSLYRCPHAPTLPDDQLPRSAVLLSLRGADPSLAGCLEGLLSQNYPSYHVIVIVDSREDPAWDMVHQIVEGSHASNIEIEALDERQDSCSLKLSALVQAIRGLDESYEVVALVDADVEVYPNWLRDLVTPLTEPGVGASNGIRWFIPVQTNWGTLVRYLWNAAACTQMNALHIPWGGSLAFRANVLRKTDLLDTWGNSLFEDTGSYRALRKEGLEVRLVGRATMISREAIDLPNCCQFIRRQMLNTRLYHPSWPFLLAQGMGNAVALATAFVLLVIALLAGEWGTAAWMAVLVTVPFLSLAAGLFVIERYIHSLMRQRSEPTSPVPWKAILALPLTHVVYYVCLLSASMLRRVEWRGITYELIPPRRVRLVEYRPFQSSGNATERGASLI